jgi:predicted HicB family RNase H-like nuclease
MKKDNRVSIEIDLEEEMLYQLMLLAHEQDITLNQLVEQILREHIARLEKEKLERESNHE